MCVCAAVPSDYICTIAAVTVGTHRHAILDSLQVKLNTRVTFAWLHLDGSLCDAAMTAHDVVEAHAIRR